MTRPRSARGNQEPRYRITPGKKPASATPSMKRANQKDWSPRAKTVAAATTPQLTMMRASQVRAPTRRRIRFDGTSRKA